MTKVRESHANYSDCTDQSIERHPARRAFVGLTAIARSMQCRAVDACHVSEHTMIEAMCRRREPLSRVDHIKLLMLHAYRVEGDVMR